MATIKAIEAKSVHQIQSGQVIVDLCSVVKELVENSLDAGASSIEIRFKNYGLDAIEVQDNGSGVDPANYTSIALKHYTSKLSTYDDLSTLQTFGFRGEAISSLSALSQLYIVTATVNEAPKGTRLEFNTNGSLKSTSTVASQKGTTVGVENIFHSLPVRQKELTKNIKREYGKVLGLLQAYACVCINVKITVRNSLPKSKSMVVFGTKGNATTRENIANVYGAKTLSALTVLDLGFDLPVSSVQMASDTAGSMKVAVHGHISRPVWGEGRQTPDRQLFFVNGRPCGLPQIAKAVNEVYRNFNVSQSPFIFADFILDTSAYDVNVSPDKRTILLHNAAVLTEELKIKLNDMFEKQEQTVPQSQIQNKLPAFRQLTVRRGDSLESTPSEVSRHASITSHRSSSREKSLSVDGLESECDQTPTLFHHEHFRNIASTREPPKLQVDESIDSHTDSTHKNQDDKFSRTLSVQNGGVSERTSLDDVRIRDGQNLENTALSLPATDQYVADFDTQTADRSLRKNSLSPSGQQLVTEELPIPSITQDPRKMSSGIVDNAFDRIRPRRTQPDVAFITIGNETVTRIIGSRRPGGASVREDITTGGSEGSASDSRGNGSSALKFSQKLRKFGASAGNGDEITNEPAKQQDSPDDVYSDYEIEGQVAKSEEYLPNNHVDHNPRVETSSDFSNDTDQRNDPQDSDSEYTDEEGKKIAEEARIARLIHAAEKSAAIPTKDNLRRADQLLKSGQRKDSTASLLVILEISIETLQRDIAEFLNLRRDSQQRNKSKEEDSEADELDDEVRLSLTVSKQDFAKMQIVGQFNLGFILAVRPKSEESSTSTGYTLNDEFFIIDQHASDEKYNFERLQATTIVGSQRLVQPGILDLTAVEEEVVMENIIALEKNGFIVQVDTNGNTPVGRRCKLTSLPLSREVVFDYRDLEELIHLLSESPMLNEDSSVPRPSKVRKMFAMRACRSSIMIGKPLSKSQMSNVVTHMGTIDKPWNCPHGRPTMRHLATLNAIRSWQEGDGLADDSGYRQNEEQIWKQYINL